MPISADCPQCGKTYRVKDELAGRKFRCQACRGVVSVPAAKAASGDPWDNLDLDSFQDQANPDEYEFETPPAPRRRKSRRKKRSRSRRSGGGGLPVGVIIAIACDGVLILFNLLGIVGNIMSQNPGGACGSVFRILIEGAIILGLLEANNVARWSSIGLSILGMLFCMACGIGLLAGAMPAEMQRQFPQGMLVIVLAVFALQIVIWMANVVALLLPSSGDYFN